MHLSHASCFSNPLILSISDVPVENPEPSALHKDHLQTESEIRCQAPAAEEVPLDAEEVPLDAEEGPTQRVLGVAWLACHLSLKRRARRPSGGENDKVEHSNFPPE